MSSEAQQPQDAGNEVRREESIHLCVNGTRKKNLVRMQEWC